MAESTHYEVLHPIRHGVEGKDKKPLKMPRGSIVKAETLGDDAETLLTAGAIKPHTPAAAATETIVNVGKMTVAQLIEFAQEKFGVALAKSLGKEELQAEVEKLVEAAK